MDEAPKLYTKRDLETLAKIVAQVVGEGGRYGPEWLDRQAETLVELYLRTKGE